MSGNSLPPGASATLTTPEGSPLYVTYGTAPVGQSEQHTGTEARIAAKGPQAGNVVGLIDQTDVYTIMAKALAVGPSAPSAALPEVPMELAIPLLGVVCLGGVTALRRRRARTAA